MNCLHQGLVAQSSVIPSLPVVFAEQAGVGHSFANAGSSCLPDARACLTTFSSASSGLMCGGGGGNSNYQPKIVARRWGTLGILEPPSDTINRIFILLVPGFTGDGLSHTEFIGEARRRGYGVLALAPKWSDRVGENIDRMRDGIDHINRTLDPRIVRVARANSFGAYLVTQVLDVVPYIDTTIFIAPCSAVQLGRAGQSLGRSIEVNREPLIPRLIQRGLIYMIAGDNIVPALDAHFENAIQEKEVRTCEGDHFTFADDAKYCRDSLDWLQLQRQGA